MLNPRAAAAAVVLSVALVATTTAGAASPAAGLAKAIKTDIQKTYAKRGLTFTTVTCTIEANGSAAICKAHFTAKAKRAVGLFTILVEETAAGQAQTKTLSVACTDTKTHKKISCF